MVREDTPRAARACMLGAMRPLPIVALTLISSFLLQAQEAKRLKPEDGERLRSVRDEALSEDGRFVGYRIASSRGASRRGAQQREADAANTDDGSSPGGVFTLVLRRMEGAWKIVHDHTSSNPAERP